MNRRLLFVLGLLLMGVNLRASAQGTAFSYQGKLSDASSAANGSYDFRFGIYDAVTNGVRFGPWLTNSAVPVSNGLFMVTLDFGTNIFNGTNWWLDLGVRKTNNTSFTGLSPRQPILPVPYAIFATSASNVLGGVSAGQLSGGTTNQVSFTNVNNTFSGTFVGNGASLTSLNGSQITSGTVADARLSSNVALLNTNQTFTGTNIFTGNNQFTGANNFTNTGNRFTGSFFGNGNVGWDAFSGPVVNAEFNHGYLLTNSQFTTVVLPLTPAGSDSTNIGYIVRISAAGAGGWQTAQATNQSIIGNFSGYRNSLWTLASGAGTWTCLASSLDGRIMYAAQAGTANIFRSTDYGRTWGTPGNNSGQNWTGIACSGDGSKVYAVSSGTGVSINYSTNSGVEPTSWSASTVTANNWTAVACSSSGTYVLAAVANGPLCFFTNAPINWGYRSTNLVNVTGVSVSADGTKLAACVSGKSVYVSANSGVSWGSNAPYANWTAVKISADGTRLAATAWNNSIYISANSGATWSKSSAPTNYWTCLAGSADCSRLLAGASNGVVYASVNFGQTWSPLNSPTNQAWSALASSADGSQIVAAVNNNFSGGLYCSGSSDQLTTMTTTNGIISGSQRSAVELQYIGNGQFMPVSSAGTIWAN